MGRSFLDNIALMFFCLPICFLADLSNSSYIYTLNKNGNQWNIAMIMLRKFDMLCFRDDQSFLNSFIFLAVYSHHHIGL